MTYEDAMLEIHSANLAEERQAVATEVARLTADLEAANRRINSLLARLEASQETADAVAAELEADATLQPCGHASKWLAYLNPVDAKSERYCLFCEVERLRLDSVKDAEQMVR